MKEKIHFLVRGTIKINHLGISESINRGRTILHTQFAGYIQEQGHTEPQRAD